MRAYLNKQMVDSIGEWQRQEEFGAFLVRHVEGMVNLMQVHFHNDAFDAFHVLRLRITCIEQARG
jgi:hypothetical protein